MPETTCIALLTDFGTTDSYVAEMKAAMLSINPNLSFVDISHHVPPGDMKQAGYLLWRSYKFFPNDTIFVTVVDPGVGSDRKIAVAQTEKYTFIAPDNGILSMIGRQDALKLYCLGETDNIVPQRSATFDGRDRMAPAAALIARDKDLNKFCVEVDNIETFDLPRVSETDASLTGEVISIDHFGNAITNIGREDLQKFAGDAPIRIEFGGHVFNGVSKTYASVGSGEPLAYIGSCELLEFGINRGNLAAKHAIAVGFRIKVVRDEQ